MKSDYPYLGQGRIIMKTQTETQTKIQWTPKHNKESDWDGIELNDPETRITHASLDPCTPEAMALIAAAPLMLEALREVDRAWAGDGITMAAAFESVWLAMKAAEGKES